MIRVNWTNVAKVLKFIATVITNFLGTIALLRALKEDYPDAEIMGHCELEGVHKACPCFSCQEYRDYFENKAKLV